MNSAKKNYFLLSMALLHLTMPMASAHEFLRSERERWWLAWNFDPWLVLSLTIVSLAYHRGGKRLRRVLHKKNIYSFWAAIAVLAVALLSPMDGLSQELSFIHMIQHLLLMLIAAPLLVLSKPVTVVLASISPSWRRRYWRMLRSLDYRHWLSTLVWQAAVIWGMNAFILWVWHIPVLYTAALRFQTVHYIQHLSFFLVSCLFWRIVIDPISQRRVNHTLGIMYLFTSSLHAAALGVLMSLAPSAWYIDYVATAPEWGWTALEDQQLAGLIMWMPACALYAVGACILLLQALDETIPAHHPK